MTDGPPNSTSFQGDPNIYLQYLINSLTKINKTLCFGISIGDNLDSFAKMFGKNYADFSDMEIAKKHLLKIFKNTVEDFLS